MAHQKRKHSNTRTNIRRSHDHLKPASTRACPNCGVESLPHRICTNCGHYKGKQVVTIKAKTKDKAGK